ncbi:unnamed protein product [Closterium sp. Yama58-4]|nr:unnamed protein product [Closterium sp. Yama58-4]
MAKPSQTRGVVLAIFVTIMALQVIHVAAVANVTLTSITLHKHINWVFLPQVYLLCADGNRSDLPFSPPLNIQVNLTGKEDWQPLFPMDSGSCKSCGMYEKGWIADSPYLLFPLCESNFSAPKGHSPAPGAAGFGELLLADPKRNLEFVLSCPACVRDLEMSTGDAPTVLAPQGLGVVVWVIAGVAVVGVLVLLITSMVYITKGGDQILDESERANIDRFAAFTPLRIRRSRTLAIVTPVMLHAMAAPQTIFRLAFSRASPGSASEIAGTAFRCFAAKAGGEKSSSAGKTGGEKPKTTRKSKDDSPKRPMSAYIVFATHERPKVIREKPDLAFADIGRVIGERWRNLSVNDKLKYEQLSQKDKVRYAAELEAYNKAKAAEK